MIKFINQDSLIIYCIKTRYGENMKCPRCGLENPDDFKYITAYENSRFSKPNLKYYEEVLEKTGYKPDEVIMVGNDVREDMIVNKLGIDSYLITDCLLNLDNEDINKYKHGNFEEIMNLVLNRL